jgi:hypothetical protein
MPLAVRLNQQVNSTDQRIKIRELQAEYEAVLRGQTGILLSHNLRFSCEIEFKVNQLGELGRDACHWFF